jgi:hypothetical protein
MFQKLCLYLRRNFFVLCIVFGVSFKSFAIENHEFSRKKIEFKVVRAEWACV